MPSPAPSHPVKPVTNWAGVTYSHSGRSTALPDPTVPTPEWQGNTLSLPGQTPTLSCCGNSGPPGTPLPRRHPRAGGIGVSPRSPTYPAHVGRTPSLPGCAPLQAPGIPRFPP